MAAGLDSARAREALTFWIEMLQFAPPEATRSTWTEVVDTFASGRGGSGLDIW